MEHRFQKIAVSWIVRRGETNDGEISLSGISDRFAIRADRRLGDVLAVYLRASGKRHSCLGILQQHQRLALRFGPSGTELDIPRQLIGCLDIDVGIVEQPEPELIAKDAPD